MIAVLVVVIVLVAINALYVAAEFAAVSVRRSQVEQISEQGSVAARGLLPILEDVSRLDKYIAACQIGITVSSLVLGAYGQAQLSARLAPLFSRFGGMQELAAESAAVAIVLVVLTMFQMIMGELVPKSVALQYPAQVALVTYYPIRWSMTLFSWFITILNGSGLALLGMFGRKPTRQRYIHSAEEIDLMIDESRAGGLLEAEEHNRLHRALQLSQRRVRQLMIPRPDLAAIDAAMPTDRVIELVLDSPFTRLPVYRESIDNIIGLLHTKDLVRWVVERGRPESILPLLRPVVIIPETMTAERALARMREERTHQAVILDEYGGVEGLITLEDLLVEVFGDVGDEFKLEQRVAATLPDGRVRLPGRLMLHEVLPFTGVIWEGDSDTVGGLVIERMGRLPEPGETLEIDGVAVEVELVHNHAVVSVLIEPRGTADGFEAGEQ
jgi:putative hemolysin